MSTMSKKPKASLVGRDTFPTGFSTNDTAGEHISDTTPTRDTIQDYLAASPAPSIEQLANLSDTALRLRRALEHCKIELERSEISSTSPALSRAQQLLNETGWLEP